MYNVYLSYKIVKLSQVNIDTHVNGEICAQLGWGRVGVVVGDSFKAFVMDMGV